MGNRGSETCRLIPFVSLIYFFFCFSANSTVVDYISRNHSLSGNQTIVSKNGIFELGFFKPGNSKNYYIGIWCRNVSIQTVVWVANRDEPIRGDPSKSELKISEEWNLVLFGHLKDEVWSSDPWVKIGNYHKPPLAELLDTGNLVLRDGLNILWQSFDNPTDTWLPRANLTLDERTNKTQLVTSWTSFSDPAPGPFSFQISQNPDTDDPYMQVYTLDILRNKSDGNNRRTEVCRRQIFLKSVTGIEMYKGEYPTYFTLSSSSSRLVIDNLGSIHQLSWSEHEAIWSSSPPIEPYDQCELYYPCGVGSTYNWKKTPPCKCLPGFKPRLPTNWKRGDWSGGCMRRTSLSCDMYNAMPSGKYEFVEIPLKNLPPNAESLRNNSAERWRSACRAACRCTAYAHYHGKFYIWFTDLYDLQHTDDKEPIKGYLYLRLQISENGKNGKIISSIVAAVLGALVPLVIASIFIWRYRRRHLTATLEAGEGFLVLYRYRDLRKATKNFSEKLGGGSFGSVFKGVLPNSTAIAVKRLEGFTQGDKQFRSEVSTIGMIQHGNLLHLRGFCAEGTQKMLVYDYVKYGSLDNHLFQPKDGEILDWNTRFQIAIGTARGLAYLHEESRECIMHCDIKPENVLLDVNFQPKVADFGMAKLLDREFSRVLTTMRGTIGYLAPEWISGSPITPKADVYSYGMMLLEIISGRRNTSKFVGGNVGYFPVWAAAQLNEGEVLGLLDHRLEGSADLEELTRACRVACWCIQDDEAHRPSMVKVVQILAGVVEVNIPPIPRRLLNLVGDEEDRVLFLDSISDQRTPHTEYGS